MPSFSTELLVVGAGATGLGVAWDACLRGIKVVVVDQGGIGQGTSGRYHGLLHSGGRYATTDPDIARECAVENSILRHIVPHVIEDSGGLYVSLNTDPPDYAPEWFRTCQEIGIDVERIAPEEALKLEPSLTKDIARTFLLNDGALDSFDLLNSLAESIRQIGGQIWLHHRLKGFVIEDNRIVAAQLFAENEQETIQVGADIVVNAAGPWTNEVTSFAGINIPITHSRGTLIAMANRTVDHVIHRCRPPASGDAIVPIGSVMVIGTTDVPVSSAEDLAIDPSEIDFLLHHGEELIPGLSTRRALRAWSGIRPLHDPGRHTPDTTRDVSRSHVLIDHAITDSISGLLTIFGGKLTTFRYMAEQVVDVVAKELHVEEECSTHSVLIYPQRKNYLLLTDRAKHLYQPCQAINDSVICECEIVTHSDVETSLRSGDQFSLDNLRSETRLGMGPCQAAFCAVRACALANQSHETQEMLRDFFSFLDRCWKGTLPLAGGQSMRQMTLARRIYLELLDVQQFMDDDS
ncbi:MAG: FAD-dependent oxidoreductase [Anaerolineales bacterium]